MTARFERHRALGRACQQAIAALGLGQVPLKAEEAAHTMTAPRYPAGIAAADLLPRVKAAGAILARWRNPRRRAAPRDQSRVLPHRAHGADQAGRPAGDHRRPRNRPGRLRLRVRARCGRRCRGGRLPELSRNPAGRDSATAVHSTTRRSQEAACPIPRCPAAAGHCHGGGVAPPGARRDPDRMGHQREIGL